MQPDRKIGAIIFLAICLRCVTGSAQPSPQQWETALELYPGIRLIQFEQAEPRQNQVRCLRIDMTTERVKLHTTGRVKNWIADDAETMRETTRDFIRRSQLTNHKVVVAVNASAFSPWPAPYRQQSTTDLRGLAFAEGVQVSPIKANPSLIADKSGNLRIELTNRKTDLTNIQTAVSGMGLCLVEGKPLASTNELHPRTGIGLSHDGRFLFILTVDGRQPTSLGATTEELGTWLAQRGAFTGMNMDGGGSTTLAWWDPSIRRKDKCRLLNSPVGDGLHYDSAWGKHFFFPSERAVGNNLGVYFEE